MLSSRTFLPSDFKVMKILIIFLAKIYLNKFDRFVYLNNF